VMTMSGPDGRRGTCHIAAQARSWLLRARHAWLLVTALAAGCSGGRAISLRAAGRLSAPGVPVPAGWLVSRLLSC
jgi:hypothetical protein